MKGCKKHCHSPRGLIWPLMNIVIQWYSNIAVRTVTKVKGCKKYSHSTEDYPDLSQMYLIDKHCITGRPNDLLSVCQDSPPSKVKAAKILPQPKRITLTPSYIWQSNIPQHLWLGKGMWGVQAGVMRWDHAFSANAGATRFPFQIEKWAFLYWKWRGPFVVEAC